jgi:4-amino-4-deoxy-L-arabinose transferase-like glycosyltransferase
VSLDNVVPLSNEPTNGLMPTVGSRISKINDQTRWRLGVFLLSAGSGWLYLWRLAGGARSEYYAAIAVSMSKNLSNFIFGALDPAGTVSLDKIPGSYWIPAIFVKLFGFSTWAVDAPNALAGIAAAFFVARATRRFFGTPAGLFAGVLIATTPIIAAAARSNQPQMFFLLCLAIASDRASAALKTGSRRSLIWSGVWIGIAFHTYMLEAWAIWPALIVAWLIAAPVSLKERIKSLVIAGVSSLAVSLIWIITVSLTPATSRPYVGGTYHNSAWEMVFGYNGLGRFTATQQLSSANENPIFRSFTPPFSGSAGFTRLFNTQVAGQIAWLIPLTTIAMTILLVASLRKPDFKYAKAVVIFFTLWFGTYFWMFSKVAGMHQFYTTSLAIPMAFLIAGAIKYLVSHPGFISKITFSPCLIITVLWMQIVSNKYQGFYSWAPKVAIVFALFATIAIFFAQFERLKILATILAGLAILTTPTVWARDAMDRANAINPTAGPVLDIGSGPGLGGRNQSALLPPMVKLPDGFDPRNFQNPRHRDPLPGIPSNGSLGSGNSGFSQSANKSLIAYLEKNRNGAKFLLATLGGMSAAPFITATGENVLPIGGFDGEDPTPLLQKFKDLIATSELKFVLLGGMGGNGKNVKTTEIESWVTTNCLADANAPGTTSLYRCTPEVAVIN